MKLKQSIFLALLVVATSAFTVNTYLGENNSPQDDPKVWTDIETAVKRAKSDQKKILVDVYTDWCKWCKVMDEKTFQDPKVATYLADNFHLAKFNAEQKEALLFNGKTYNFKENGRRGHHEFVAEMLDGRMGYPSLLVFDSKLNKLEVIRGYKKASELMDILSLRNDS